HEAPLASEPLLDLRKQRSLIHARRLPLVLLEDALRVSLNRRLLAEIGAQRVEHALFETGDRLLGGEHLAVEKPFRQKRGGALKHLLAWAHEPRTISRTRELDNVLDRPVLRVEMIVVMQAGAAKADIDGVIAEVERLGYRAHPIYGVERTVIGCIG